MYFSKGFSPFSFSGKSFSQALLAKTEARLGIFYIDFDYDKSTNTGTNVKEIPPVKQGMLKVAIDGLEDVISGIKV